MGCLTQCLVQLHVFIIDVVKVSVELYTLMESYSVLRSQGSLKGTVSFCSEHSLTVHMSLCISRTFLCHAGNLTCARDLYLEFKVSPSFDSQADKFMKAFRSYVQNSSNTQRFGERYELVSCWQDCRKSGPHRLPGSKKNNNGRLWSCGSVFKCVFVQSLLV